MRRLLEVWCFFFQHRIKRHYSDSAAELIPHGWYAQGCAQQWDECLRCGRVWED